MSVFFLSMIILFNCHNIGAENEVTDSLNNGFMLSAVIRQLFEMFRNVIKNGDIEKNIPVLDPHEFDHASLDVTTEVMSASANITKGMITGLARYQLGSFTFTKSDISMELLLNFPMISFQSEYYEMEGKLFEVFQVSGNGQIQMKVQNLTIRGKLYFKQSDDSRSVLLSHFENMDFVIEKIISRTQFDNNIDGIINAMVGDLLAGYLSRFSKAICITYGDLVKQALNSILNKIDNWHIIAAIL